MNSDVTFAHGAEQSEKNFEEQITKSRSKGGFFPPKIPCVGFPRGLPHNRLLREFLNFQRQFQMHKTLLSSHEWQSILPLKAKSNFRLSSAAWARCNARITTKKCCIEPTKSVLVNESNEVHSDSYFPLDFLSIAIIFSLIQYLFFFFQLWVFFSWFYNPSTNWQWSLQCWTESGWE